MDTEINNTEIRISDIGGIMANENRFEDKLSVADLMKKPQKLLIANIYQQVVKTNGTVRNHEERLDKVETGLENKMDWGQFKRLGIILTLIISLLTIPSLIINIIKLVLTGGF